VSLTGNSGDDHHTGVPVFCRVPGSGLPRGLIAQLALTMPRMTSAPSTMGTGDAGA